MCLNEDAVDVVVVAPPIHSPFVAILVVPDDIVLFLGAAVDRVHAFIPHEVAVKTVIRLDLAKHNVAGSDDGFARDDGPKEADITGID